MSTNRAAGQKGHFYPVEPAGRDCIRRAAPRALDVKPLGPPNPFNHRMRSRRSRRFCLCMKVPLGLSWRAE